MEITELIKKNTIILNLKSSNKEEVIEELIEKLYRQDKLNDREEFKKQVLLREKEGSTGIGDGIAIPHAKTKAVKTPAIALGRSQSGLDFDSIDGIDAKLFFMIAARDGDNRDHLETISKLAKFLMDKDFVRKLLNADSVEGVLEIIENKERDTRLIASENVSSKTHSIDKILAVTSCPTGIAHTYMAADALEQKALEMGVDIKVETNGSTGVKNPLTEEDIMRAQTIIIAADTKIYMDRFDGKKVIKARVSEGIKNPEALIKRAIEGQGQVYRKKNKENEKNLVVGKDIYDNIMNGVSNMLPFVVGGGILIALSFLFDFKNAGGINYGEASRIAFFLKTLGETAFSFMLPILAGYIAFSIGDRPALAPGFIGGALAKNGDAGFLGALIAGFLAGYTLNILRKVFDRLPKSLEGIKPVLLYPLFSILIVGFVMNFIIIPPVEDLNTVMNNYLNTLGGSNRIILGILLGAMMAFDMGGPINKAAYVFGLASLSEGNGHIMAAVMAGGMVPPLGIAMATSLFKEKFTKAEIDAGKTNYIMGLSFITEGAIPFAAADPKTVIPSAIIGSALAGGLSEMFGASSPAPHGGIFVLPVIENGLLYLASILIGSLVTAILLKMFKKDIS